MYCYNCGNKVEGARFCPYCGASLEQNGSLNDHQSVHVNDKVSIMWCILSFLFPFVGIIGYFVFKGTKPVKAKGCLTWGLISMGINFLALML